MVFISKVDRVQQPIDKRKLKRAEHGNENATSFAEALEAVADADAVEVILSDEKQRKNPRRQPKKDAESEQENEKKPTKLNIQA